VVTQWFGWFVHWANLKNYTGYDHYLTKLLLAISLVLQCSLLEEKTKAGQQEVGIVHITYMKAEHI
jgi:hypothetical protein